MKKFLALLLTLVLCLGLSAGFASAEEDVEVVQYYCSVGAYLIKLQEEIDKWNETTGAEEGVYIELISNINTYGTDLEALMQAGTFFDLIDVQTNRQTWIERGWVKDLETIENEELQALIESYEPYIQNGINIQGGMLFALPLEVVPIKMAVNLDLFEKNNLELPETWDDVVECARIITENGNGEEFGYGWSTWSAMFRRLTFKATMNSTGRGWWDPNTETYDFSIYETPVKAIAEMYQNGWMLGADDLGIDEIRAQFAAGRVGMFPAPSYDYAVYTSQFPAECNWTVIDMPTFEEGEAPYKGVYLDRVNLSICAPAYDNSSDAHKEAIEKAFIFLNSDELNASIYAMGGMIPYKMEIIENTEVDESLGEQWTLFSDLTNYASVMLFPDNLLPLEGDTSETVMDSIMRGDLEWEDSVADLNERYNAAYQQLKEEGDIDLSIYAYEYDISR